MTIEGYVLTPLLLNNPGHIDITQAEYDAFAKAIACLRHVVDAEEKFATFIDNYFELEQALLSEALTTLVFLELDSSQMQSARRLISRRIINLLTSAKLCIDSLPQHASELLSSHPGALQRVIKEPSQVYDRSLGYRVMEALRNYSQHEALPVHNWSTGAIRNGGLLVYSVSPSLDIERLENAKKFKASVLTDLKALKAKLELKPYIREYVEGIGSVQHTLREETKGAIASWKRLIRSARATYSSAFPSHSLLGLYALPVDGQGMSAGARVPLAESFLEYIEHLQLKTRLMVNFSNRRVEY